MKILGLLIVLFSFGSFSAQVNWTKIEDLADSVTINPKPVYVMLTTEWCGYCKLQKKNTLGDAKISKKLNQGYYCVLINAETSEDIVFNGKTYASEKLSNGRYLNSLAKEIGLVEGKMAYPTNIFMDSNFAISQQYQSYLRKSDFKYVLKEME